jgi:hypothetical protein
MFTFKLLKMYLRLRNESQEWPFREILEQFDKTFLCQINIFAQSVLGRQDTQHNDTQHNDTSAQQHSAKKLLFDSQHE